MCQADEGQVKVANAWSVYIEEEGHGDRGDIRGGTRTDTEASTNTEEGAVNKREVGGGRARFEVGATSKRELQVACREAGGDGEGAGQGLRGVEEEIRGATGEDGGLVARVGREGGHGEGARNALAAGHGTHKEDYVGGEVPLGGRAGAAIGACRAHFRRDEGS